MLQLGDIVLKNDEYYIKKMFTGIDELIFDISIWDEHYPLITEEASILETERGQTYLVKAIDGGKSMAKVRCLLDLDDFYGTITVPYTNGSATLNSTVVPPSGWTFHDYSYSTITRTITLDGATPMDVIDQCRSTYGVIFRFDNKNKVVSSYDPEGGEYVGAFMTRDLNLKEINYKGVSTDLITALYCEGKDGMTFASINDGRPYVTNGAYKSKLIWGYWKDERYTVPENFLADATAKLALLSVPSRSYTCDVADLAKTNPELYAHQDFDLLKVVDLVDDSRNVTIQSKVVEYWDYPYYPDRNVVTISTVTPKMQLDVKQLNVALSNPNSTFQQVMSAAQESATQQIIGGTGGYVVMNTNAENRIYEILIMDTNDVTTATKVWRWNSGGLGYSSTGYEGTYATAITQDGSIVADFIAAGTLNASLISVINLIAEHVLTEDGSGNKLEIDSAMMNLYQGTNWRAAVSNRGSTGSTVALSGNTSYPEPGDLLVDSLLDDDARVSIMDGSSIYVGLDRYNLARGLVSAESVYTKYVQPRGEGSYEISWKQVNLSAGGTAWALCRK